MSGLRARVVALGLAALGVVWLVPDASGATEPQLPNLVPLKPYDIRVGLADGARWSDVPTVLRFSVAAVNRGNFPLDLLGVPTGEYTAQAYQCVRWASARTCGGGAYEPVGEFVFHAGHGHFHIDGFALYELRRLVGDQPDMTPAGLVATSGKVSFCLQDTEGDPEASPSDPADSAWYSAPWYNALACLPVYQGISPGWADVYDYDLPGQQIDLETVPAGRYGLVITLNPEGRLRETTRADDVAFEVIQIDEGGCKHVTVPG